MDDRLIQSRLYTGPAAIAAAGLDASEVRMLAAYLYDRRPQRSIAEEMGMTQPTLSRAIRAAVLRLEQATGLKVPMPAEGSRRDAHPPMPRLMNPFTLRSLCIEQPAGGGLPVARRNGGSRHRDGATERRVGQGDGG